MARFDADLVKHTKRSTRLMAENIDLRNTVHKQEVQMQALQRRLAVKVTD